MATSMLSYGMEVLLLTGFLISVSQAYIELNITIKDDGTEPNLHDMEIALQKVLSGNISANVSTEVLECTNSLECLKNCPVGYVTNERGCQDCSKCSTEGLFEGDIIVQGEEDFQTILDVYGANYDENGQKRSKRDALKSGLYEWPKDGNEVKIPYVIDSTSLGATLVNYINSAIADVRDKTCIRFVARGQETDYIKFHLDSLCGSRVGKRGGMQLIKLNPSCALSKGVVIHEIMHTLGFWHEHSRPDRDQYVEIIWNNLSPYTNEFDIQSPDTWDSFDSPYDIDSIMQYGGYAGALDRSKPTIKNRATGQPVVAQTVGFSTEDVKQIKSKYKCGDVVCQDKMLYCKKYWYLCARHYALFGYFCPSTCGLC